MAIYITHRHMAGGTGHEHIESVKWTATDGSKTGTDSRAAIVAWIKNENGKAYVRGNPTDVPVLVVDASPPYVRTYANGQWTDNLLALPTF